MPKPLDQAKRDAILASITAGGTRNAIAREHHVSVSTVTKLAREAGATFDRSHTKNATAALVADNRARRAALASRLLDEARIALDDMHKPALVFSFGGRDNEYNERILAKPPTADRRNLMTIAAVAIDKHVVIERHDADAGQGEAVSMLGRVVDVLTDDYQRRLAPTDDQAAE